MSDPSIRAFITRLEQTYGPGRIELYATVNPELEHGLGFRLGKVAAIFSVITLDGSLPFGRYDVQIESDPPGDYIFNAQLNLEVLMRVIARVAADDWPENDSDSQGVEIAN